MIAHLLIGDRDINFSDNYDLGLVKGDNGFKVRIFNIIDIKDMKYQKRKHL